MSKNFTHRLFQLGMIFKGVDGLIELVGGIALLAFGPTRLNHWVMNATQYELDENPHQFFAHFLSHHAHGFSPSGVHFAAFYLLFQGAVKLWLAEALLRERARVFPIAMALMSLFELYMIYRFALHPGTGVATLFVLNLIIIMLIWREWQQLKKRERGMPFEVAA
jgi:uncharacterized membrane protein